MPLKVVLRRKVVGFRLALLPNPSRKLVVLMQVVRNWPQVIEKLAQKVAAAILLHHGRAQKLIAHRIDRFLSSAFLPLNSM